MSMVKGMVIRQQIQVTHRYFQMMVAFASKPPFVTDSTSAWQFEEIVSRRVVQHFLVLSFYIMVEED